MCWIGFIVYSIRRFRSTLHGKVKKMCDYQPIQIARVVANGNDMRIFREHDYVDVKGEAVNLAWKVLAKCDGMHTVDAIADALEDVDNKAVKMVINDLSELSVLSDSRRLYKQYINAMSNPSKYFYNLSRKEIVELMNSPHRQIKSGVIYDYARAASAIGSLQSKRHSVRSYTNDPVSLVQVGSICSAGYSYVGHAVPSGGNMYPLKVYVIVSTPSESLPCGYYEYDPWHDVLVRYDDIDQEAINFAFCTSRRLFNAPISIVIASDIDRQANKYANLSYKLSLVEAGQVAQNITLAAIELGLGTCELGGVLDEPIARELGMPDGVHPIVALTLGRESCHIWEDDAMRYDSLKDTIVESGVVSGVRSFAYDDGSFFCASAEMADNTNDVSGGTSSSRNLAEFKATVEAFERYVSTHPRIDTVCPVSGLGCKWLDLRRVVPLTKDQLDIQHLDRFCEERSICWTRGVDYLGQAIMVPSELVYYGGFADDRRMVLNDSSGVAAYTDYTSAVDRACLELIERDALMRMWFQRQSPARVAKPLISTHIVRRIEYWKGRGWTVDLLILKSDFAPTVLAIAHAGKYPYFVSGAAAAYILSDAVSKAYEEMEFSLLARLEGKPTTSPQENNISSPSDHGDYYASVDRRDSLRWMWEGSGVADEAVQISKVSDGDLLSAIHGVVVDMSRPDLCDLVYVVRVISEDLVPISFGINNGHYTHQKLGHISSASVGAPHFFA